MNMKESATGIFFKNKDIEKITPQDIEFLKNKSKENARKSARMCLHKDAKDKLHEMIIVHTKEKYIRPHKHSNKAESLHVIEGNADAVFFDEKGNITNVVEMGPFGSGSAFYCRISQPVYHSLIIKTDFFAFHESTEGPFDRSRTIFAPWSPEENDDAQINKFINLIRNNVSIL